MANQGLKKAILQTIKYSDHFHFPLTITELHQRLIGYQASKQSLQTAVNSLVKSQILFQHSSYFSLPNKSSLVKQRRIHARLSAPLLTYAKSLIPTLARVRPVRAVFLTGSLAMKNTDGHDDIDLMIIADSGKLWTTRLLLTLYTSILGIRRTRNTKNIMGKLCLNLYLTTNSLAIPISKRSLYSAYELIQIVPLYDPHNLHAKLLTANLWVNDYLPNYLMPHPDTTMYHVPCTMYEKLVETISYYLQYLYMKSRITREYVTKDAAFFHPRDPSPPTISTHKL
jgi:hypothetical protein